jgi:hypothetical protein
MERMIKHSRISYIGLIGGVVGIGCSAMADHDVESDVTENDQALYGGGSLATMWSTTQIPVCFRGAGNETRKVLTREILDDTWSRVTPLRFTGFGMCTSSIPAELPNTIAVSFAANSRGFSPLGASSSRSNELELTSNDTLQRFRYQVMHEFGHSLGFHHDQVRPDNWNGPYPVFCDDFNPGEEGGAAGGIAYTGADNLSVMSYCAGFATALSARDVLGVRKAYGTSKSFSCQDLSDIYGIDAGVSFQFAPTSVRGDWVSRQCNTHPSSADACQKASDLYGIDAGVTWGFAPSDVQSWWGARGCNTKPLSTVGLCQRASDTYGIVAGETFGTAPSDVQAWWVNTSCNTVTRNQDACQRLSDAFGITVDDTGWAPSDVVSWWTGHSCRTAPVTTDRCQLLSDLYGIDAGVSFNAAPNAARTWWVAHGCNTHPVSNNTCQRASDAFAIVHNVSWGFAPSEVQSWWGGAGCSASPTSKDTCQTVSNQFGIVAGQTFGAAPADVRNWWVAQGCNARPVDARPIPGRKGVVVWPDGKIYFFHGAQYTRYDIANDRVDNGYPANIAPNWPNWPASWTDGIDAGLDWGNGKVYLFRDSQYVRYDIAANRVDPGYPLPIAGNWGNWPASFTSVDAVVKLSNGKIYFFHGSQYVRYDIATDRVDPGYPVPIAGNWPGVFTDGIDYGLLHPNGMIYFFQDTQYRRFNLGINAVDRTLPIAGNWPGAPL